MNTVAIIPCHNEARFIAGVASRCAQFVDQVIVVDNLSTDTTQEEALKAHATVVSCDKRGVGMAIKEGMASVEAARADIFVTLDGDGQHDPADIPLLMDPIQRKEADVVIGVRTSSGPMPKYRQFGNWAIMTAANFGASVKVADAQCGFRAFSRWAAAMPIESPGFGCIAETIIKARTLRWRIAQVPVKCIYHDDLAANSSMPPIKHGLSVLMGTLRWRVWEHLGL